MKRMIEQERMMAVLLTLLMALPIAAQYGRPVPVRSVYGRSSYNRPPYSRSMTDVYYGLRLGLDISIVNSDDRYLDGGTAKTGLNAGFVVGFQLSPGSPVYLETGLSYMEKGGKGMLDGKKFAYSLDYLELPIVMKYCYNIDHYMSIQPFFGGFVGVGVAGKIKDFGERRAYSSYDGEGFQRFDAGLRVGCGILYDHVYAELGYDFGLANISHDYFDTSHTGCFFATIGVNF